MKLSGHALGLRWIGRTFADPSSTTRYLDLSSKTPNATLSHPKHMPQHPKQSITVEMSALVSAPGSGSAWTVGLSNGGNDTVAIGDLAMAGASEWTTTAITVPLAAGDDGSLANYLDDNGEMLITLTSASPDSTQVCGMVGGGGWPVHIGELVSTSPVPDVGVTISQIFRHGDLRRCPRAVKKIQAERDLRPAPGFTSREGLTT